MSDLRKLTFAINIEGNENPVVKTDRAMDELVKTTGKATKELGNTSKGIRDLGSSKNRDSVEKSKRNVEDLTKSLGNAQSKLNKLSSGMNKISNNLTKYVTAPIVGVGIVSAKLSQDLNKDMATISTMIPGQTKRLYELKGEIQDISIAVAKDTKEIASGTYGVISAYGDAADTMNKVAINAKAATAAVATTDDALNLSSAIMKAFGDTSAKANEKVMDLAFGTLKLGQTSFAELASSMGRVVPLTTELKISQEELFGVYATATGVTGNASEVSTQYRGILQSLMAPTKEMTSLISKMGYQNGKAMIEGEGLGGSIQAIVDSSKASGKPMRDYISSVDGQTLALALAGNLSEDYRSKTEKLMKSQGMMEEAFKEQTEGINASGFIYAQSMQRMKVAGQNLGEALGPTINILAKGFETVSEKLANVSPETLALVAQLGMAAVAAGPLIKAGSLLISIVSGTIGVVSTVAGAIGVVTTGATAATPAIGALATGFAILTGPIGLTVAAFGILTAAGVAVYKNWDKISAWGKKAAGEIKRDWQQTKDDTVKAWNDTKEGISKAIGNIKTNFQSLKDFVKNPIKGTVNIVRNIRDKVSATAKVDGSHATGKARIPFDGYIAETHKDEEILKADDPRNQNNPNFNPNPKPRSGGIMFSPVYNIEISGKATESDKEDLRKVIDEETRRLFNIFFKEMSMKMA